jgi:hypothetical protein
MQYLMLVRVDPGLAATTTIDDVAPWVEEGTRRGLRVQGEPVEEPETATTVRVRDGEVLLSDGPFAETKEIVAGYDLIDAPDLATAVDYAGRHPVAAIGALEVRELQDDFFERRQEAPVEVRPKGIDTAGIDTLFLHVPQAGPASTVELQPTDLIDWIDRVESDGTTLGGARLRDATDTTGAVVRVRGGELLVSRGPFAELAEQIAGIDLIRSSDLDEALAIAAAHPTSWIGAIVVRPFPVAPWT